jgi:hypothetical protein
MNNMRTIQITEKEQAFINGYLEAIDFTETGDIGQPEEGTSLDDEFTRESILDCLAFYSRAQCYLPTDTEDWAGHDFWLTRNRHGSGFWDKADVYGDSKDTLSKIAESFGEVHAIYEQSEGDK